jgi:hypothetical protein
MSKPAAFATSNHQGVHNQSKGHGGEWTEASNRCFEGASGGVLIRGCLNLYSRGFARGRFNVRVPQFIIFEGLPGGRFNSRVPRITRGCLVLLEGDKLEGARIGAFYICTTLEGAPGDGQWDSWLNQKPFGI